MLASQKTTRPLSVVGEVQRLMIKVRYCLYTRTQRHRSDVGHNNKHETRPLATVFIVFFYFLLVT